MTEEQYIKNLSVPKEKIDVILDTDAFNEIDDQFALSYLINNPEKLNAVGFCAAPFFNENSTSPEDGMEKSYYEILKLLTLTEREELLDKVYRGSREYLKDEQTPICSEAAKFMTEKAKNYSPENPLYIVAIGAITNVASALLLSPEMKENTVIVWLGGHARHFDHTKEFNLWQDVAAARVVMGCGVPFIQLPCMGVVDAFIAGKGDLSAFYLNKNPLADYLAENTITTADSYAKGKPWTRVIWDVTAVGWLLNENGQFMSSRIVPTRLPSYGGQYEEKECAHKMCYVYHISRDNLFTDLTEKITGEKL